MFSYVGDKIISFIGVMVTYGVAFIFFCVDCVYCQMIRKSLESVLMRINAKYSFGIFSNRYNVPFYILSSAIFPISLLAYFIGNLDNTSMLISYFIYAFVYCMGMHNAYIKDRKNYLCTLEHNLEFLEISIWPSIIFMTIAGFYITVTGQNVDVSDVVHFIFQIFWTKFDTLYALVYGSLKCLIMLVVFIYSFSFPLQLLLYVAIRYTIYYQKHLVEYRESKTFCCVKKSSGE